MSDSRRILLGKITGLYGVKGWVKVFSYTHPLTNILTYSSWQLRFGEQWQTVTVTEGRIHNKGIIARLESCVDRDAAIKYLGAEIAVEREQLPTPLAGEYYWTDLIGLKVINREGNWLGAVEHLLETGANDVLIVKGERERLIPLVFEHVILEVDLVEKILRVDWDADF
jgi:16S rRNA processing protein RimM